jgi:hypothetical protein
MPPFLSKRNSMDRIKDREEYYIYKEKRILEDAMDYHQKVLAKVYNRLTEINDKIKEYGG